MSQQPVTDSETASYLMAHQTQRRRRYGGMLMYSIHAYLGKYACDCLLTEMRIVYV